MKQKFIGYSKTKRISNKKYQNDVRNEQKVQQNYYYHFTMSQKYKTQSIDDQLVASKNRVKIGFVCEKIGV